RDSGCAAGGGRLVCGPQFVRFGVDARAPAAERPAADRENDGQEERGREQQRLPVESLHECDCTRRGGMKTVDSTVCAAVPSTERAVDSGERRQSCSWASKSAAPSYSLA